MKDILRRVKELLEAAEPDMTVIEMNGEPFACPIGVALGKEYRKTQP